MHQGFELVPQVHVRIHASVWWLALNSSMFPSTLYTVHDDREHNRQFSNQPWHSPQEKERSTATCTPVGLQQYVYWLVTVFHGPRSFLW
jgi:hypothetical protein